MINNWNIDINFWELYPDLKIYKSFKKLHKSDKSRGKESSSKIMWFVSLTTSMGSKYYNVPLEERYEIIEEDYMEDKDFRKKYKDKLPELIQDFQKLEDTPVDRHLRQWDASLDDRTNFLSTMKYTLDTYEDLDKMAANTSKVFDTLKKIKDDKAKELAGGGSAKGGGQESLSDTGEI